MIKRTTLLLVLLAALLADLRVAAAHANLAQSVPAPGATLASPPPELILTFTEAIDPSFSKVELLDSAHQVLLPGPGVVDSADPAALRLALGTLPVGSYTAIWRVRSTVDGHVTEGSLPFGIGVTPPMLNRLPPIGAPDPATALPFWGDSGLRAAMLLAALFAGGVFAFGLLVWRPLLVDGEDASIFAARLRPLLLASALLLLLSTMVFLVAQAAAAAGVSFGAAFGAPLRGLLGGRSGQLGLARLGLTVVLLGVGWRLAPPRERALRRWMVGGVAAGAVLATFSLGSHAAALRAGAPLAIALDWLHLAAATVWLGGLPLLLLAIAAPRVVGSGEQPVAALIRRFSRVAMLSVIVLTITGIYSSIRHVVRLDLLFATAYGWTLVVKVALFGLALLLAWINRTFLIPRLGAALSRGAALLRRNVGFELALGILVLLAVGVMTSSAPSEAAWIAREQAGLRAAADTPAGPLVLRVAPGTLGSNALAVDLTDERAGAAATPAEVLLRIQMRDMDMGEIEVALPSDDGRRFATEGTFFSMAGIWNVEVIVRRPGFDDIRQTFPLPIQ